MYEPGVQTGITISSSAGTGIPAGRFRCISTSSRCVCGRGIETVNEISGNWEVEVVCANAEQARKNRLVSNVHKYSWRIRFCVSFKFVARDSARNVTTNQNRNVSCVSCDFVITWSYPKSQHPHLKKN